VTLHLIFKVTIHMLFKLSKFIFCVYLPLLLTPSLASAQPLNPVPSSNTKIQNVTIADIVRVVVQNNPSLKAALRTQEATAAAVTSAGALQNPRIESMMGRNDMRLPSAIAGAVSGWGISQQIENPSVRSARQNAASFGRDASVFATAVSTNELVAQVRIKAFEYLLRREEAKAASDAMILLEQIQNRVRIRVESGEAARYEIIKADAEVINARQKLNTALLLIEQSRLSLNRLAAGFLPPNWQLQENLSDALETPALQQIQQAAQSDNPELKLLQAESSRRAARVSEARASRWPGVDLRFGQMRDPEIRQNLVSFSVQIPITDQKSGPIAEAVAESARAGVTLDGRRADLQQQILVAWKSMEIARVRVNALSTGAVREAEAALRVAEAAYRFGERGILDVLDAQRLLRSVNADLLDARFQVQTSTVDLEFLSGIYADPSYLNLNK
jgi:cobalt-zinc-cadmium efflux system outer membrane protein